MSKFRSDPASFCTTKQHFSNISTGGTISNKYCCSSYYMRSCHRSTLISFDSLTTFRGYSHLEYSTSRHFCIASRSCDIYTLSVTGIGSAFSIGTSCRDSNGLRNLSRISASILIRISTCGNYYDTFFGNFLNGIMNNRRVSATQRQVNDISTFICTPKNASCDIISSTHTMVV